MRKHPPKTRKTVAIVTRDSSHELRTRNSKLSSRRPEHNSAVNFAPTALRRSLNQRHRKIARIARNSRSRRVGKVACNPSCPTILGKVVPEALRCFPFKSCKKAGFGFFADLLKHVSRLAILSWINPPQCLCQVQTGQELVLAVAAGRVSIRGLTHRSSRASRNHFAAPLRWCHSWRLQREASVLCLEPSLGWP